MKGAVFEEGKMIAGGIAKIPAWLVKTIAVGYVVDAIGVAGGPAEERQDHQLRADFDVRDE